MLLYRADQLEVAESRSRRALVGSALMLDPLTVGRGRRAIGAGRFASRCSLLGHS